MDEKLAALQSAVDCGALSPDDFAAAKVRLEAETKLGALESALACGALSQEDFEIAKARLLDEASCEPSGAQAIAAADGD
eukprot:SAG31_NODE_29574_length_393_cov_0.690476_1_plen_79_part_10